MLTYTTVANAWENATNQFVKFGKIYGVRGTISFTNPNIGTNPSAGSFHRVAVTTSISAGGSPATTMAEVGWIKNYYLSLDGNPVVWIIVTHTNQYGQITTTYTVNPQQTTHQYSVVWTAPINQWSFQVDNQWVFTTPSTNFVVGSAAVAGGEVYIGTEKMAYTTFSNLQWLKYKPLTGQYVWKSWKTNQTRLYTGGFQCTTTSVTQHYCYP